MWRQAKQPGQLSGANSSVMWRQAKQPGQFATLFLTEPSPWKEEEINSTSSGIFSKQCHNYHNKQRITTILVRHSVSIIPMKSSDREHAVQQKQNSPVWFVLEPESPGRRAQVATLKQEKNNRVPLVVGQVSQHATSKLLCQSTGSL